MAEKLCVFCNQKPTDKTKEHVLPRWLLELTGDPNREVDVGLRWKATGPLKHRFAYSSLTMPACHSCNAEFAALEGRAQAVVTEVLRWGPLTESDVHNLLDWLDKVRVGLWHMHRALGGNIFGIRPNFGIKYRMAARDRMVAIYRPTSTTRGLTFSGTDLPLFAAIPSCFALWVNGVCLFNHSHDFVLARPFGLPFPKSRALRPDGITEYRFASGTCRRMGPFLSPRPPSGGVEFYQPTLYGLTDPAVKPLYDPDYTKEMSSARDSSTGAVWMRHGAGLRRLADGPTADWPPEADTITAATIAERLMDCQIALARRMPSLHNLPAQDQASIRAQAQAMIGVQETLRRRLRADSA